MYSVLWTNGVTHIISNDSKKATGLGPKNPLKPAFLITQTFSVNTAVGQH
jgi:hypothetical protein